MEMNKRIDIARMVSKKTGYNVSDISEVLSATADILEEIVLSQNNFKFGFIEGGVKKTPARSGISPLTGVEFSTPEHLVPYVKLGQGIKLKYREIYNGKK